MTQHEQVASLRAELCVAAVEEGWNAATAEHFADVAVRRWRSFERRSKPNKRTTQLRIRDLIQGLRQASPFDLIYLEPGAFERLAPRFAELLSAPTPPTPQRAPAPQQRELNKLHPAPVPKNQAG